MALQATKKRSNAAQISDKEVASDLATVNPDIFDDPDVREYLELFASDELSEVGVRVCAYRYLSFKLLQCVRLPGTVCQRRSVRGGCACAYGLTINNCYVQKKHAERCNQQPRMRKPL